jgi:hypothetical protein
MQKRCFGRIKDIIAALQATPIQTKITSII